MHTLLLIALIGLLPLEAHAGEPPRAPSAALAGVRSWGYQLQNPRPAEISRAPFDLVVIDYSRDGSDRGRFRPAEVDLMKQRPGGGRRILLAYLSIGEAEDYRFYWDPTWIEEGPAPSAAAPIVPERPAGSTEAQPVARAARRLSPAAPSWLGEENAQWSGNFRVEYWEKAWQDILLGSATAYLDRILAAGFDGVYLDRVDAFYDVEGERTSARAEMADLVTRVAAYARARKPGFLVVPQNGEELLDLPAYVAAIDAIAKEDLLYGSPTEGQPNSPRQIANSLRWLAQATAARRPVLVVEYLDAPEAITSARRALEARRFVPAFAPRALDRLGPPPPRAADPAAPAGASGRRQ